MKDLTEGRPFNILWKFSLPMLFSMVFQQLYQIADSIIAGKFVGKECLAAVGASYPITVLFIAVASGASMGCSVVISQTFGKKEYSTVLSAVSTAFRSIIVLAIGITVLGFIICVPILQAIHTPENILKDSALYMNIYIAGLLFLFLYNGTTAVFTALGDSKTPLYFLIFSSLLNIILDIFFVTVFSWGIAGVAWATFMAQGIASLLATITLAKKLRSMKSKETVIAFDKKLLLAMGKIAIPSILQQSFVSIGQVFVQGLINSYGADIVAGYSAAFKINTLVVMSIMTMANAFSSYTAQNIGANKIERIYKGYQAAMLMTLCVAGCAVVLQLFLTNDILALFVKTNQSTQGVIDAGVLFLKVVAPFHLIVTIKLITDAVLRGSGIMYQFMTTTFTDLILRVSLSFLLAPKLGFYGICLSYPIGWTVGGILSFIFYKKGTWKHSISAI